MKKLLSILMCVVLGVSSAFASKATATATATVTGLGWVYVSQTNVAIGDITAEQWQSTTSQNTSTKSSWIGGVSATVYSYAKPQNMWTFMGWSTDNNETIEDSSNPYKTAAKSSLLSDATVTHNLWAIFKPVIECKISSKNIIKQGTTGSTTFEATLRNPGIPDVSITKDGKNSTDLTCNISKVDGQDATSVAASGVFLVEYKITALENATGEYKVTINAANGAQHTITVTVLSSVTITFLSPTNGEYTYTRTNGDGTNKTMTSTTEDDEVVMTDPNQFNYTLSATAAEDYRFNKWVFKNSGDVYENPYQYTATDGDEIIAEFIHDSYAMFKIKGKDGVYYSDLNEAIAAVGGSGVIVVHQSGILAPDNYTIPSGVTLLVPGDDAETVRTSATTGDDFDAPPATRVCKKYLTVSDNTTITIANGGAISVYAKMSNDMPNNGVPYSFGRIDLGNNCHIVVESGAVLSALGYITGDPDKSSVTIKSGATVYEAFQIRDWRGGSAVMEVAGSSATELAGKVMLGQDVTIKSSDKKVFPIGQYYLQTIETKLIVESGAQEILTTAAEMGLGSLGDAVELVANAPFIVPDNNNYPSGFFRLGTGVQLIKSYDRKSDRQVYEIKGSGLNTTARFGHISLVFPVEAVVMGMTKVANITVSSEGFVFPITNNIDVTLDDVTISMALDMNLLGDASLTINNNAAFVIDEKARFFISDKEESKSMWYGATNVRNATIMPLDYTPDSSQYLLDVAGKLIPSTSATVVKDRAYYTTGSGYLYKRQEDNIAEYENDCAMTDARLEVNGKLIVNGRLYTTQSGADITSSGSGTVEFKQVDHATGDKLYRYMQVAEGDLAIGFHAIPVTNAKLHNDESTNSSEPYAAINAQAGETYTYVQSLGRWLLPQDLTITSHNGENFALTLPEDKVQNIVCNVQTENNTITKANFEVVYPEDGKFTKAGEPIYDATAKTLTIPIKYAHQNKHNVDVPHKEMLVVNCKNLTNNAVLHTEEIELKAIEDYTPQFTLSVNGINYANGAELPLIVGTGVDEMVSLGIVITAEQNNVANERAEWSNECALPFEFEYGIQSEKPFENAVLTYSPTSAGEHEGTFSITASYTDANDVVLSNTITLALKAKVDLKQNTWAFATFPEKIYNNTIPFELINAETINSGAEITTSLSEEGIITISGTGTAEDPYMVTPIGLGSVTITAVQEANRIYQGRTLSTTITVISSETLPVALCVNSKDKFNQTLYGGSAVTYNTENNTIDFNSTSAISEWIFRFDGTPDVLSFTPIGNNTWSIQQRSTDDAEWEAIETWATFSSGESKSWQLKHTTSQLRIQYGSANSEIGTLADVCVSEMLMSANVNKLYMPIYANEETERTIVLTHTLDKVPNINFTDELQYTTQLIEKDGYFETTVTITANSETAEGLYEFVATEDDNSVSIMVSTYNFPQELPIKLATDEPANGDRYYYVTTASSYAQWDAANRQIIFQNPGAQLTRSVTFAFNGAPSVISLEAYSVDGAELIVDSVWTIEESKTGLPGSFEPATLPRDTVESNRLVQELNYTTRYVRVNYNAVSTREIRLSNIVIEGYPDVIVEPQKMMLTASSLQQKLFAIAINLQEVDFVVDNTVAFQITTDTTFQTGWTDVIHATDVTHSSALGVNKVDTIFLGVQWNKSSALDEGKITVVNKSNGKDSVLTVVNLMGSDDYLAKDKANQTGIYTGINDELYTYHNATYTDYTYHPIDLTNTFAEDGTALFDYLIIYGETTPSEGTDITAPLVGSVDGSTDIGSNAVTPYFVYRKAQNSEQQYKGYRFVGKVDNANISDKAIVVDQVTNDTIITKDTASVVYINVQDTTLSIYMTGFCPYATTGYDKLQEGVFLFRGTHGAKLDLYLEDFHVFSRNKTKNGNAFYGKDGAEHFSDSYARGSGGVLVFENVDPQEQLQNYPPFNVSIHTMGNNLLKSNYGCFFGLNILGQVAMKATQVSSPIQIHMYNRGYERKTKTNLNFDDIWPMAVDANGVVSQTKHTNGYLGLKKQANNAPSIDIGNKYTEVTFNGGRIELQNSQIGSDTYKTTLAISHRSGYFGADDVGIQLCYGIGTDSVGGTVNFLDGTIMVERMRVGPEYRQYYLMDTLSDGKDSEYTSCLRTPKNTYVRGGSTCPIRACQHVTSKGGAPKERENGKYLGRYIYKMQQVDIIDTKTNLATINGFPKNIEGLSTHYQTSGYNYGLNSVTPDADSLLYFWLPEGFVDVEKDAYMSTWKACMTEISAGIQGIAEGSIGGDTPIEYGEEVKYFLYCQLDKNIHDVISAGYMEGDKKKYTYKAPLEVPSAASAFFGNAKYTRWAPNKIGSKYEHQVLSDTSYTITDKVYYITTATADLWQTFTAPFDVENIYVVETYSESALQQIGDTAQTTTARKTILREQANHNADFAAFFAVAMAMGSIDSFDEIYESYIEWAKIQDRDSSGIWNGEGDYTLRGMQELVPYTGNNWRDANFYLNHNNGNWTLKGDEDFEVQWEMLTPSDIADSILLHKGETYSMLFPYCTGCEQSLEDRTYWDYWSGKFLIFESVSAPQTINGRNFLNDTINGNVLDTVAPQNQAIVTGNSTFAFLEAEDLDIYVYENNYPALNTEYFGLLLEKDTILPTATFLYTGVEKSGMPARRITRDGKIIYDKSNTNTDVNQGGIPTVGGGNDLFITSTEEGINIAVAEPQQVRVVSSTGWVIFSGMVSQSVDVPLSTTGIYIVSGENEVHKIVY